MKEILVVGLVVLALIGIQIVQVLKKINQVLVEIRESLPDKNFRSDTESEYASIRNFWYELRISMNRLARIYDKYVLGKDYKSEIAEIREKMQSHAKIENDEGDK